MRRFTAVTRHHQARSNADAMQEYGCCDKTKTVKRGGHHLRPRHFDPMRVAMENREYTYHRHRNGDRHADPQRNNHAQHNDRQCDAGFDMRDGAAQTDAPAITAMVTTNAAGTNHRARPPSCAASRPTATMAST